MDSLSCTQPFSALRLSDARPTRREIKGSNSQTSSREEPVAHRPSTTIQCRPLQQPARLRRMVSARDRSITKISDHRYSCRIRRTPPSTTKHILIQRRNRARLSALRYSRLIRTTAATDNFGLLRIKRDCQIGTNSTRMAFPKRSLSSKIHRSLARTARRTSPRVITPPLPR